MRTISVVSQKVGAGKTTIAVHLASTAQSAGLSVAIIDMNLRPAPRSERTIAPLRSWRW